MSTLPLSGVNSRFLAPSRFPAFHLKSPAFLAYFELEKMHSVQLVKANSLCKMVNPIDPSRFNNKLPCSPDHPAKIVKIWVPPVC